MARRISLNLCEMMPPTAETTSDPPPHRKDNYDVTDEGSKFPPLPEITTHSHTTELQRLISSQPWEGVSSRLPVGNRLSPPSTETLVDFASTILESRLADVVRHRNNAKASIARSHASSLNSVAGKPLSRSIIKKDLEVCRTSRRHSLDMSKLSTLSDSDFNGEGDEEQEDDKPVVLLTSECRHQLRCYVRRIASLYLDNRYHAMEHAVHVTMSANKLLDMLYDDDESGEMVKPSSASIPTTRGELQHTHSMGLQNVAKKDLSSSTRSVDTEATEKIANKGGGKGNGSLLHAKSSESQATTRRSNTWNRQDSPLSLAANSFKLKNFKPPSRSKRLRPSFSHLVYSDTFTKFSFVFAAIIHDVEHQGVPNARLVVEEHPMAHQYDGISVAEKHSIKVAFRVLNNSQFDEFRSVVFESPDDRLHMHHIVTNLVISTDIASPERMRNAKLRWEEAFSCPIAPGPLPFSRLSLAGRTPPITEIATVTASEPKLVYVQNSELPTYMETNSNSICSEQRRNSIKRALKLNGGHTVEYFSSSNQEDSQTALRHSVVIETMLNVADVAHAMQSWDLFLFWNRNLFEELFEAYSCGRSASNPANGWYENQLFFYKIYILPLAEKMQKCGVFGELGGTFIKNAILIRDRWESEGEKVTKEMLAAVVKFHAIEI